MVLVAACASSGWHLEMEPGSVARQLGVPRCRASVPLTQAEVLENANRLGDPYTESRPEWSKTVAEIQPGDQLRLIDCVRANHNYYYAHIHEGVIVTKMYTMILD